MSRRSNQKLKLLYLLKILNDMTDERRGMTLTEILAELSKYGIETGRKSLYDDLEALRVYGVDICSRRDRYVRYYIGSRKFERVDVKLIADLLTCSPAVSDAKCNELIKKLWQSEYMAGLMPPERTAEALRCGDDVLKNVQIICDAIAQGRAITFKYFEWNSHRQRILCRSGERITITPKRLRMKLGKYLLEGLDHSTLELTSFSPERMLSLSVSDKQCKNESAVAEDGGDVVTNVRLKCKNEMASYVFDHFGSSLTVLSNREDEFDVAVKARVDGEFFSCVFLSGGGVRILSPEWAVSKFDGLIEGNKQ
jgi:predicted DNA-binding transcriptional regulator YafY